MLIKLHELVQVQDCLQHSSWLDLALCRFLYAFHDLLSLVIVQDLIETQKGNIIELLSNRAVHFCYCAAYIQDWVGALLQELKRCLLQPFIPVGLDGHLFRIKVFHEQSYVNHVSSYFLFVS